MSGSRGRSAWIIGAALGAAVAAGANAGGDTPTWSDALEASPNRATPAEQAELAARAASGESALQAPPGVYAPNAAEPSASADARPGSDTTMSREKEREHPTASDATRSDSSRR